MTKQVLVSLRGEITQVSDQLPEEEPSSVELTVTGTYYNKNGKHYVLYEEREEAALPPTKTRLIFDETYLDMKKSGYLETTMVFDRDKEQHCYYSTPYGKLLLGIVTREYQMREEAQGLNVLIGYGLYVNEEHVSDHTLELHVKPV